MQRSRAALPFPSRPLIRLAFAFVIVPVLTLTAGCGKEGAQTTTAIPADEALARSKSAMAGVTGFKFELTHPTGTTSLPGGLFLTRADGAVAAPDRLSVNAEANFGRVFIKVQAVVIGGDTYMTNFLTGAWGAIPPQDSPFGFLDPVKFVSDTLGQVAGPAYETGEGNGASLVVRGEISAAPFAALVGTVDPTKTVKVRLTLDLKTYLLKEVLIEGQVQPEDGPNAARLIRLSGFGEQIVIEKPV